MVQENKKKTLLSWPILVGLLVLIIIAFGCGCGFDLNISNTLYNSNKFVNNIVGGAISNVGLAIGLFVIFTSISGFVISSYVYKNTQRWKTITANVIGIIGFSVLLIVILIISNEWVNVFGNRFVGITFNVIIKLCAAGGAFCFSWFFLRKFNQETVFKVMFWLMVFIASLMILRLLICMIWSRPRPRLVFDQAAHVDFRPVWEPDPFKSLYKADKYHSLRKSFPSGHTATAGMTLALAIALNKINAYKNDKIAYTTLSIAILIMFLTGLGRMIGGWHFMTDVSFGALMSVSFFVGFQAQIDKRIR